MLIFESLPTLPTEVLNVLPLIETVCVAIFTVDYMVRVTTVPIARMEMLDTSFIEDVLTGRNNRRLLSARERLRRFILSPLGLADFFAFVPFWVEKLLELPRKGSGEGPSDFAEALRLLRVVRTLKLAKFTRFDLGEDRNLVLQLFSDIVSKAAFAFQLVGIMVLFALVTFGSLIWFAEKGEKKEGLTYPQRQRWDGSWESGKSPFESIPKSFWWVLVTISTVGYGDFTPVTILGYCVGGMTIVFGAVVFALPVGMIGTTFSHSYDQLLLEQAERKLLERDLATFSLNLIATEGDNIRTSVTAATPLVVSELRLALLRLAMVVGIPLDVERSWESQLDEVTRFEQLAWEHPCESLEKWAVPIFMTLRLHSRHAHDAAAKPLERLRHVWYMVMAMVARAYEQLELAEVWDRRIFETALLAEVDNEKTEGPPRPRSSLERAWRDSQIRARRRLSGQSTQTTSTDSDTGPYSI